MTCPAPHTFVSLRDAVWHDHIPCRCSQTVTLLSCSAQRGCARTAVLAHTSDSEAEEPEEELQEGEEAATAEVEAEEAEGGEDISPTTGSDGADSVAVSDLKLTARATAALAHRLPTASAIAFSFTLSAHRRRARHDRQANSAADTNTGPHCRIR